MSDDSQVTPEEPENQPGTEVEAATITGDRVEQVDLQTEMQRSYLDYAMAVIVGRALPDVRDGLKPVHRRVLFAMTELGAHSNKPYYKSARIVGDVIGKYHPHGDASVYDAMVRLAQDFAARYPLVDGQGNFGNIDGDGPAAYRYTEARLAKAAAALLEGIDGIPILLDAAERIGVDPAIPIMAVAYGDQWTNMLQPFWALPVLAIAGQQARTALGAHYQQEIDLPAMFNRATAAGISSVAAKAM